MPPDTEVTIESVPVMYVTGDPRAPVPEQAIDKMESLLTSLRGRRCYGVIVDGVYRACVALRGDDNPAALGLIKWIIPGGRYVRRKLTGWNDDPNMIPTAVGELLNRPDIDRSRHIIEFYRSHRELRIMAPVK